MRTIFKYPLEVLTMQDVRTHVGAKILTVQTQRGEACVWMLVDDKAAKTLRRLIVVGTGHEVTADSGQYIGTFQTGAFVFHVFDLGEIQ